MTSNRIRKALVCSVGIIVLSSCGGGNETVTAPPTPVAVAPPPAPPPSPPPAPPPTPSPSPTLVGAASGQTLSGAMSCARDPVQRNSDGHVIGLPVLTGAKIDNSLSLLFRGPDSYSLDVNGFGGSSFAPGDKRTSSTLAFDQFINSGKDEFYIAKSNSLSGGRTFATHGLYNESGLCFFAVGLPAVSLPNSGSGEYFNIVDGIARIGGVNLRLLPSIDGSSLTVNYETGAATLNLTLSGRPNPFEEFTDQSPASITTATASLQLQQGGPSFAAATLTGSGGFSGTVTGSLVGDTQNVSGNGGSGAVFSFEMRNAAGEVIFGVVTAERIII